MECRVFEITLVSATDLPDVRKLGQMKVYAVVSLSGSPETAMKTPVDNEGETNPTWNCPVRFTLHESTVQQPGVNVVLRLYCERSLAGDKTIGEGLSIPVKGLFDYGMNPEKTLSYVVPGTTNGVLCFSYSFGEKIWVEKQQPEGSKSVMKETMKEGFLDLVRETVTTLLQ